MKKYSSNLILIHQSSIKNRMWFMLLLLFFFQKSNAQLYINGDIVVQEGVSLYANDSITLGTNQSLVVYGIVQSNKGINTNGNFIQTLNGGSIISPVSSGVAKNFDIGTNSNNRIQILQNSGSTVNYQLNVSDNIFINPQTKVSSIAANVVNKTWTVQPLTASTNTTVSLFWNATDEISGFNRTNCAISRWQQNATTSWSFSNVTATAQTTGVSPSYSRTINTGNLTSTIYYFGVGGSGSSLPIELLDFNANNQNEDVKLEWTTSLEINNSHFEVQRSTDNINWDKITTINGAGNSNIPINYEFVDFNPFNNLQVDRIFYRLKQIDFDGSNSLSDLKIVYKSDIYLGAEVSIYPNPSTNSIHVKILNPISEQYEVELTDMYGKTIKSIQVNSNLSSLDIAELSSGVYFIKVIQSSSQTLISTVKIFKN